MSKRNTIARFSVLILLLASNALAATNPITFADTHVKLHPDVVYIKEGDASGYKFHVVFTPYPPDTLEIPNLERSNDGETWTATGITNPVINNTNAGLSNYSGRAWPFDSDPDLLYIREYGKWFMIWGPRVSGSPGAPSGRTETLAFAYSTNGLTWTQYAGTAINGNSNPQILSGTDSAGQAWETTSARSHTQYPTCVYQSKWFTCWYGTTGGNAADSEDNGYTNQVSEIGMFKFQWDNVNNNIINFTRYASNPVLTLAKDASYWYGIGHIDVTILPDGQYMMIGCRLRLADSGEDIVWLTSPDGITWTNHGQLITIGSAGAWDDTKLYRSSTLHDGEGRAVILGGKLQIMYSGFADASTPQMGWWQPTLFGTTFSTTGNKKGTINSGTLR